MVLLVVPPFVQCACFLSQLCRLSVVGEYILVLWCGVALIVAWDLYDYNRKLSRGAWREILLRSVIVRAFAVCKSDALWLPEAEQQLED